MKLQSLGVEHLDALLGLGVGDWSRQQVMDELGAQHVVGGFLEDQLVAYIVYHDLGEALEILHLATHPERRRQGYMRALLERFLEQREAGKAVWLEVNEHNQAACHLYLKLGFRQVGIRPRYYPDGGSAKQLSFS